MKDTGCCPSDSGLPPTALVALLIEELTSEFTASIIDGLVLHDKITAEDSDIVVN